MEILITLVGVRPGAEAELASVLSEIGADPAQNHRLPLSASLHTHFVRFVVFGESGAQRLLFVANYDGPLLCYLDELSGLGSGICDVFSCCVGWSGPDRVVDFLRETNLPARGVYIGFPGMTAASIRDHVALREGIEGLADALPTRSGDGGLAPVLGALARLPSLTSLAVRAARRFDGALNGALIGLQDRERDALLKVAEAFSRWGEATSYPLVFPAVGEDAHPDRERAQTIQTADVSSDLIQNQMTTLTTVRPERLWRLQLALVGASVLSKWSWQPGEFAGVGTLHWFAWALVNHGRELIFVSVFDGSWKNYMQDFMDKLVWGLDSLYSNTDDYPKAGMHDSNAFTRYILDHQWPPQVFYSAYPSETVINLMRDRAIAAALPTGTDAAGARAFLESL